MHHLLRSLPLLIAGLASAELVPVLSAPRAVTGSSAGRSMALNAWGDTLVAGRYRYLQRFVRRGDVVVAIDSIVSDSVNHEQPLVIPTGDGYHLVTGSKGLLAARWSPNTAGQVSTLVPDVALGHTRAEGGFASLLVVDGPSTASNLSVLAPRRLILCAQSRTFQFSNLQGSTWVYDDSVKVGDSLQTHCSIDEQTNLGVRMVTNWSGTVFDVTTQNAMSLVQAPLVASPHRPSNILTGYFGAWLGYNVNTGTVYLGGRSQGDSIKPDVLKSRLQTFLPPVRKDSLVVFGVDSSLVLAKWTLGSFRVMRTVKLDGRLSWGLALADSTLWANVDGKIVSFRVGWKEDPSSGVSSRDVTSGFRVTQAGRRLDLAATGLTASPYRVLRLDGTLIASGTLQVGQHASVKVSEPGMLLLQTQVGTRSLVVR